MRQSKTYKLVLSAIFMALGMVLPFLTAQIPSIGNMLLPMHIPVLLCGFICGAPYGLAVGFITPILRSVTVGMPPLFPTAVPMAFELAAYGCLTGFLYRRGRKGMASIYLALIGAMIGGRVVWGLCRMILAGVSGGTFTGAAFIAGALTAAIPGIILQLVLIPVIVSTLEKAHLMGDTIG